MSSNLVIPENELPTWMKQAQRGIDWGAILVLAFCILVAWSFITQEGLSAFTNSEHYVYRTADYAEAFKQGHLYPRWSPDTLGGYGAEIPNYYPPGAAYISALIEVLLTNDSIAAVRLAYTISFLLAGSMVYALVKQHTNAFSGIIASLIYIFSPFIALTVPHRLGDLDISFGVALLPMFLWSINRLLTRNHTLDYVLIAFIFAAIILTKPIMLIQALLLASILFAVHFQKRIAWGKLGLVLSSIIAGIGLSAFYWIPALIEQRFVKWSDSLIQAPNKQLSLNSFFARTQLYDADILVREPQFNLGWLVIGFTILTIIALTYWRKNVLFSLLFLMMGILLSILGLAFFTENIELLAGIVLCFAIASSYPISILPKNHIGTALSALVLSCVFIGTLPIWNMPEVPQDITSNTLVSQQEYENKAWGLALLTPEQAIPSFVSPSSENLPIISTNFSINGRLSRNNSVQSTLLEEDDFGGRYRIITQEDTHIESLRYLRAYAVGWKAVYEGQALDIVADEDGLIKIVFPDDFILSAREDGILSITHATTTTRLVAWSISIIAISMILIIGWQRWQTIEFSFDSSDLLTRTQIGLVTILLAIGILLRYNPTYDFFSSYITYPLTDVTIEATSIQNKIDELELWRFQFEDRLYQAEDILDLTLFWKLHNSIDSQHQIRIRMISRERQATIILSPYHYPSQLPTNRWSANLTVLDSYQIALPQDLESGSYNIMIDVSSCPEICLQGSTISPQSTTTIQLPQSLTIK